MIKQTELGTTKHKQIAAIWTLVKRGTISLAGNRKLKIYGRLDCGSGKRMKPKNRIFFKDDKEAEDRGYRPCGNCMPKRYQKWKGSKP